MKKERHNSSCVSLLSVVVLAVLRFCSSKDSLITFLPCNGKEYEIITGEMKGLIDCSRAVEDPLMLLNCDPSNKNLLRKMEQIFYHASISVNILLSRTYSSMKYL